MRATTSSLFFVLGVTACGGSPNAAGDTEAVASTGGAQPESSGPGYSGISASTFTTAPPATEGLTVVGDDGGDGDGSTTAAVPEPPYVCAELPSAGSELLIDDVEPDEASAEPDPALPLLDGRNGGWSHYNDGTMGGTHTRVIAEGDAAQGQYSMHMSGGGFTDWGAAMVVVLYQEGGGQCAYDASVYDGIRFWAKSGTEDRMRMHITIPDTLAITDGGRCLAGCYDDYGVEIRLTDAWTEYSVTFDELSQVGWGTPVSFTPDEILAIHFHDFGALEFDVWVDDLRWYVAPEDGATTGEGSTSGEGSTTGSSSGDAGTSSASTTGGALETGSSGSSTGGGSTSG